MRHSAVCRLDQPVHPDLGPLAALLGEWHGEGEGRWGGGEPFHYREWVTFSHNGKPFLAYSQRTLGDDGRPLHAETGFWRPVADGSVEVAITHPIGVVEIELGRWAGTSADAPDRLDRLHADRQDRHGPSARLRRRR